MFNSGVIAFYDLASVNIIHALYHEHTVIEYIKNPNSLVIKKLLMHTDIFQARPE